MEWWKQWTGRWRHQEAPAVEVSDELTAEIWRAHQDWVVAQQKLDYALDHDQIDYAIYIVEAAEKRYDMLLRQAKRNQRSG